MKPIEIISLLIIVLLGTLIYFDSLDNGFIWDDDVHIYKAAYIKDPGGLTQIWFKNATPQYYPLSATLLWFGDKIWGLNPKGYHILSLIIHTLNALLLYFLVKKLFLPFAFPAALIFAVHPIGVETVAWASELKNLLSLFFFLASFLIYLKYLSSRDLKYYLLTFISFLAAIFSKYISVSFALVPLFYGFWLKGRIEKREIKLAVPFISVGILAGLNAVFTEIYNVGAKGAEWTLPLAEKIILSGKTSLFYIYKMIYPKDFIFIYPRWELERFNILQWLPIIFIFSSILLLFIYRKKAGRSLITLFIFYFLSIFPASGFFNVYPMRYSYVADHFSYLSSPWIILLILTLIYSIYRYIVKKFNLEKSNAPKRAAFILLGITTIFLSFKSQALTKNYQDKITLYESIIAKNPGSWMANANLAILYSKLDKDKLALKHYRDAITAKDDLPSLYYNLGNHYYKIRDFDSAINSYMAAIILDPDYGESYANLANVYRAKRELNIAIEYYRKALLLKPDAVIYANLGHIYYELKDYQEAVKYYNKAFKIAPDYENLNINLALSYYGLKDYSKAKEHYALAAIKEADIAAEVKELFEELP